MTMLTASQVCKLWHRFKHCSLVRGRVRRYLVSNSDECPHRSVAGFGKCCSRGRCRVFFLLSKVCHLLNLHEQVPTNLLISEGRNAKERNPSHATLSPMSLKRCLAFARCLLVSHLLIGSRFRHRRSRTLPHVCLFSLQPHHY
jgi:hypothetical protein